MIRRVLAAVLLSTALGPAFAGSSSITVKDSAGNTKTYDVITDGVGNFLGMFGLCDGTAGAQCVAVKAASTAPASTDPAMVVTLSQNAGLGASGTPVRVDPTGTTTQPVSGTVAATQSGTWNIGSITTLPSITGTVTANAGTNLNTSALALDTSVNGLLLSQGSTTSGEKGPLLQGAVTTSAPTYTTAQTSPLSLDTAGNLRVDPGTVTVTGTVAATQSGSWNVGQTGTWNVGLNAGANTIGAVNQAGAPWSVTAAQATAANLNATVVGTGTFAVQAAQSGTWNLNNISGTVSLPTGAATSANQPTNASQGSTTSGQTGTLVQGAVTTSAPTYTTAQTSPISLDTAGNIRVNCTTGCGGGSGGTSSNFASTFPAAGTAIGVKNGANMVNLTADGSSNLNVNLAANSFGTLTVSGTVTANAGTGDFATNLAQVNGSTISTATTGVQKVGIVGNAGGAVDAAGQNASSPANSILTGCQFNTSPTTITSGNMSPDQCDNAGNRLVSVKTALPAGSNTIGAVTQASGPWTSNVTQFGGTNISTGTGASGSGIPRVTISNDSSLAANQSVNVNQIGGVAVGDPCMGQAKLGAVVNLTASGQVITGTASKKTYICSLDIVVTTAGSVALVEGTGTTCATNIFGLAGGTTAGTGWPLAANGGLTKGSGVGTVYSPSADTNATAANVCLLLSGTGQTSGHITYVQQ